MHNSLLQFESAARKVFCFEISTEELQQIFIAYTSCKSIAFSAGRKVSERAESRRTRSNKARNDAVLDVSTRNNPQISHQPASEHSQLSFSMFPQWLHYDGNVGSVVCQEQSPWESGSAFEDMEFISVAAGGNSGLPGDFQFNTNQQLKDAKHEKPFQWLVSDACYACFTKKTSSWACIDGLFYCERCWAY